MSSLRDARALGVYGGQLALFRATRKDPTFGERARAYVLQHLREHGPTTGEILTQACKRAGLVPTDDRAMGPVYSKLQRDRHIVCLRSDMPRFRGHGSAGAKLWGLAPPP